MSGEESSVLAPLDSRYLHHLTAYLLLSGWRQREFARWNEFYGAEDTDGAPILLVLPREANAPETQDYMLKALDILNALVDEPLDVTVRRVQNYSSDLFLISNLETGTYSSITLRQADQQIRQLKQLVVFGARAEQEPRPFFQDPSKIGQRLLDQFRFGHTFRGSFGLTVEIPLIHDVEQFETLSSPDQPPLLPDLTDYVVEKPVTIPPLERRIVERIVRGLQNTRRAVEQNSIGPLVTEYGGGFNANMCLAVAGIGDSKHPIEFRVLWSPKIPPSDDLLKESSIRLNETGYLLLREASEEMKRREPQVRRIRGIVTHVGSNVPPLDDKVQGGRQVIIRWIRDDMRRTASILVPLNKDQYMLAYRAHIDWATVAVTGVIERVGTQYRLLDAQNFEILNPLDEPKEKGD